MLLVIDDFYLHVFYILIIDYHYKSTSLKHKKFAMAEREREREREREFTKWRSTSPANILIYL